MNREQVLACIAQARALIRAVQAETDNPAIAQCLRFADQNLHWAQWNLGAGEALLPELEPAQQRPGW
jgi:hypothetical protein